jgi:serine/threonine-protein kinase
MNAHYSAALLESALAGQLPSGDEAALFRHLDACESCSHQLEQLAGGPAWCREARALLAGDELDAELPQRCEWSPSDFSVEHLEPADQPGVLGRLGGYDVLEIIGQGGMGVVLKARDRELARCVAIKVLAPHLAHSSLARQRFAREAQAAAAVVHPHVLAIHHVQSGGRLPFLVMPLVAGQSLAERIKAQGTLELKEILRIGMQAAAGLAAAHEQGLVHRDVKPANLLLEKGVERAVLTDFGLARAADDISLTRYGIIAGTPEYMSPEQARGEPLDGRSDLFSLGAVLYEMATGVSPFRADSTVATIRRLVDEPPQALSSLNPELPPWFATIVNRLLDKDPSRRFSSAREVSQLLEGCLAHVQQPAAVPLPAALAPPIRRSSPNSRHPGVFVMLALFTLTVLGIVLWQAPQSPGPQSPETQSPKAQSPKTQSPEPQPKTDAAVPKQLLRFAVADDVTSVACTADGSLIAVASGNPVIPRDPNWKRDVQVLDGETGKVVVTLTLRTAEEDALLALDGLPHFSVGPVAFAPDGSLLAVATGLGQVKLFRPKTGELVLTLDDEPARLAEKKTPEKFKELKRAMGSVGSLAFSPDGTLLAMCGTSFEDFAGNWGGRDPLGERSTGPGRLKVFDVKTGKLKHDLVGHSQAFKVAFSSDGSLLVSAGRWGDNTGLGNGVLVWNPQTGEKLRAILIEANGGTHMLALSPTNKLAAIGSLHFNKEEDTRSTSVGLTYPLSGITQWQRTFPGAAVPKAFLPDGKSVALLCDGKSIRFVDVESGQVKYELAATDSPPVGRWSDAAIAPQAKRLIIATVGGEGQGAVTVWDLGALGASK